GLEASVVQRLVAMASVLGWAAGEPVAPLIDASAPAGFPGLQQTGVMADLWWLSDVVNAKRPYSAVVHCFCGSER
ncbi:MAG: hypothetical protein ACK47O_06745, partial [Betaproteobacteria bacterium]